MISFSLENTSGPFMKSINENGISFEFKMKHESHRLGSFETWSYHDKARPIILAKLGFYSTDDKSDSVTCFSCGAQKSNWTYRSDIESEHKELNPECLHIRGQDKTNVPILIPDEDIRAAIWSQLHLMYCDVSDTEVFTTPVNRIDAINNVNHDATRPIQPSVNRADSSTHYSKQHNKYHLPDSREAKLRSEEERLRTFNDGWPHRLPTPADLAKEGFFFTQVADRVQCIFCNGILKNWEVTDNPSVEHKKHFPGCGFVRKREVGNIPRGVDIQTELGITLPVPVDNRIEVLRLDEGSPVPGIVTEPPRHPQYVTEASRIASFTTWPKGLSQTPQMLAKAGFFYAGFDDSVKCFYCDGGLRTWEANDDPWKEHAKWFSRCPFVLQVKGEDFIRKLKNETSDSASSQTEEREITARLDLPAVQKVLHMDIPRERVKLVIRDRLNRTGDDFKSAEDLLNAIYHLGDNNRVMPAPITPPSRHSALPPSVPTLTVSQSQNGRESAVLEGNNMSLGDTESSADHESLLLENQRLKDQRTCKICMDEEANIVLLPCGHLVSCASCAPALRKCPICRASIKGTVRTYIS